MPMYALATLPLIKNLNHALSDINQVWYADDASAAGKITRLREWWNQIETQGPKYGYFANAIKTWLVTKENCLSEATAAFTDTEVKVTSVGRPYLGAALGTDEYTQSLVESKVQQWSKEIEHLATIAYTQPHAAHAAFTHGMTSKWSYLTRTIPDIGPLLQPLEAIIRTKLAPALTSRPPPNDTERKLLALPARLGGIALSNPIQATDTEFLASTKITEPLKNAILQQHFQYTDEVVADQLKAKKDVYKMKRQQIAEASDLLKQGPPPPPPPLTQAVHGPRSRERSFQLVDFTAYRRIWICTSQGCLS